MSRVMRELSRENEAIAAEIPLEGGADLEWDRIKGWEEKKRGLDRMFRDFLKLPGTEESDMGEKKR